MSVKPWNDTIQYAIAEVEARIRAVYPEATFRLVEGEDPIGLYLDAYTDAEDAFAALDLVSDWLVDLSVDAGVHLHVISLPHEAAALYVSKRIRWWRPRPRASIARGFPTATSPLYMTPDTSSRWERHEALVNAVFDYVELREMSIVGRQTGIINP